MIKQSPREMQTHNALRQGLNRDVLKKFADRSIDDTSVQSGYWCYYFEHVIRIRILYHITNPSSSGGHVTQSMQPYVP